jgi:hypothetical protein
MFYPDWLSGFRIAKYEALVNEDVGQNWPGYSSVCCCGVARRRASVGIVGNHNPAAFPRNPVQIGNVPRQL